MAKTYTILELPEKYTEDDLRELKQALSDEFDVEIEISQQSIVDEIEKEEEGFTFDFTHVLPVIDVLIIVIHLGREREWDEQILDWLKNHFGVDSGETIDTREMEKHPDEWMGKDLWGVLLEQTKENIQIACHETNEDIPNSAILHTFNALEIQLKEWYDIENRSTEKILVKAIEFIKQNHSQEESMSIAANLLFIKSKRDEAINHSNTIDIDDVMITLLMTRKTFRKIANNS